jgi:uncharacterized protein
MSEFHFSPRPNRAAEIQWRDWDEQAFAEAAASNKPILLAISAVWCHWCHVMDETTYSDVDVIKTINERFVPVRVDNDRRPDINARYNQGGWPTTAFLTADGDLLKGATYLPPDQMRQLLLQLDAFYADPQRRSEVAQYLRERKERTMPDVEAGGTAPVKDVPDRVFSFLDANFDERFGGFGTEQKFPQTPTLHFLLDLWARRHDGRAKTMVQKTLHAMADGGMYDHVDGGFYRYSTTRDYSVPHFEKMLEDLGALMLACARAAAAFGDSRLGIVAREVRSYLDRHLWNDRVGAYGGSQDADEEFYRSDAAGRASSREPFVDPIVYCGWNAQAAEAMIIAGPLLAGFGADADDWTARGVSIVETLWSKLMVDGLMCRYYDDAPHMRGLLGDQAWSARAALAAYEATGESEWLGRARTLIEQARALYDADNQQFADRLRDDDALGRLSERSYPLDENALMARVLLALASFTGNEGYAAWGRSVLERWAPRYRGYGIFAAAYGSAALDLLSPPIDVKIEQPQAGASAAELRKGARAVAAPPIRIHSLAADGDGRAVAMLCDEQTCFARVASAHELRDALKQRAGM